MASKERVTDLVVRAHDQYSKVLNNLKKMQADVAASSAAAARRSVVEQKAAQAQTAQALQNTQDEIRKLAGEFKSLSSTQGASREQIAQLVIAKMKLQARANELKNTLNAMKIATHGVTNAQKGGFAAFIRNTDAIKDQGVAADVAAVKLKRLNHVINQRGRAGGLMTGGGSTGSGFMSRGRGDSGGRKGEDQSVEMYGLKPYQMVNLGYQVNDVISGLAMGQQPIQILAQQVGQFVQIWPQMMVGLIRGLPVIAGLAAAFAPLIAAIIRVNNEAATLDEFNARLATMADGGRYTAEGLAAIATEFEKLAPFLKAGFDQKQIADLFALSGSISGSTGEKFESVSEKIATAFSGNSGTIRELDKELNFLTASQMRSIRAMEQSGDTAGAMALAQQLLEARFASSAKETGVWGQALTTLGDGWNTLVNWLKDTAAVNIAIGAFDLLGKSVLGITAMLRDLISLLPEASTELDTLLAQEAALNGEISFVEANPNGMAAYGVDLPALREERDLLRERITLLQQSREASNLETLSTPEMASGGTIMSEEDLKRQDDFLVSIREGNIERYNEAVAISKSGLELEIYNNTIAMQNEARREGIVVTDEMVQSVVKSTTVLHDARTAQEQLSEAERNAAAFVAQHRAEYDQQRDTIAEVEQWIARLTAEYGAQSPQVMAAQAALSRYKAEAASAAGTTNALVSAVMRLRSAMAAFGSFSADLSSQMIRLENQVGALEAGVSEVTYRADEMVRSKTDALLAAGATPDRVADAYNELMIKAERIVTLQKQRNKLEEQFIPKDGGGGGSGSGGTEREQREEKLNELLGYRKALLEQIKAYEESGNTEQASALKDTLAEVNAQSVQAIDNMIAYLQTMSGPEIETAILNLQKIRDEIGQTVDDLKTRFIPSAEKINDTLAEIGSNAFSSLAEAIANGTNIAEAFFQTLLKGIGDFLIEIGKAIVKQALFNAISGGTAGGGAGGWLSKVVGSIFHGGGVIGGGAPSRPVNPAVFANAQRFHGGGVMGLKPGEVPIIGMKDEEVLTRDDPRHVMNGGGEKGANLKVVNVLDPVELLEAALASETGESVLMNFMSRRSRRINGLLTG